MLSSVNSIIEPSVSPLNQLLQQYCNSSDFVRDSIWRIAFSPCSKYLAIPKIDIDDQNCVLIIRCSDWHSRDITKADICVHNRFNCTTAIRSLAFGQKTSKLNPFTDTLLSDMNLLSIPKARCGSFDRRSSLSVVNRRYDFTKNLFLAAGLVDGKIQIWNIDTGELTLVLKDHRLSVCGLHLAPNRMQLASCSHDTTIKLWDLLDDGNMYMTLNKWTHVINEVKWSPDETILCAVGAYELVVLFDTITWEELFRLDGHLHTVVDCAFSADSAFLVTASHDTCVLMWSTATGEILKRFAHKLPKPLKIFAGGDNGAFVRSVAITKSNHFLVTACDDNEVRWFSLNSDHSSDVIFKQTVPNATYVVIASDGKTMATSNRNGEVHLFSTLSTLSTSQPSSLKSFCRSKINMHCSFKRKDIFKMPISHQLINYVLYKGI